MTFFVLLRNEIDLYPQDWTVVHEDNGWCTIYPNGRTNPESSFFSKTMSTFDGLCAILIQKKDLNLLEDFIQSSLGVWTLEELKIDENELAQSVKSNWIEKDEDGYIGLFGVMM